MFLLVLLVSLILATLVSSDDPSCKSLPETCKANILNATSTYPNYSNLNTSQLIKHYRYPVELHKITTDDGYILTAQRIPYSTRSPLNAARPKIPVLLVHGFFASSAQWMWQPPNRALAFMLVDAGYDVWLSNNRGTSYSTESAKNVSTSSKEFWDFSYHEMGKFDLPALVEYIKAATNQNSLYYIGHSLGTTSMFAGVSVKPSIQKSIRTYVALSPDAFQGNATNLFLRTLAPLFSSYLSEQTTTLLSGGPLFPSSIQSNIVNVTTYCAISTFDCSLCSSTYFAIFGFDPCQTNFTMLPGILAHLPDSVSGKTLSHILQHVQSGTFNQYDYGPVKNWKVYRRPTPPKYNWGTYTVPTVFFHSDGDNLAVAKDVQRTARLMGSAIKEINQVPYTSWTPVDMIFGIDADIYIYNRILEIFNGRIYG